MGLNSSPVTHQLCGLEQVTHPLSVHLLALKVEISILLCVNYHALSMYYVLSTEMQKQRTSPDFKDRVVKAAINMSHCKRKQM